MNYIIVLLLAFFSVGADYSGSVIAPTPTISDQGITSNPITSTTEDITLYVETTGNDSNDCLSSGNACLTIQEAIDRVPKHVKHDVSIFIAEGAYGTMHIGGFTILEDADFIIRGVLENSTTLASGTATGTADGGSTTTCTDSGQAWTNNDLIGRPVYVDGEYRIPYDNDGTNIYFRNPFSATCNGKAYEIKDHATTVQGTEPAGLGPVTVENNFTGRGSIEISNIKSENGETIGFFLSNTDGIGIKRCWADSNTYAYFAQQVSGTFTIYNSYAEGATWGFGTGRTSGNVTYTGLVSDSNGEGYHIEFSSGITELDSCVSLSSTTTGIYLKGVVSAYFDTHMSDADDYGVIFSERGANINSHICSATFYNSDISNATTGGMLIDHQAHVILDSVTGTGNAGYGVDVRMGSHVIVDVNTTITGATADATINGGNTDLSWATHFATDGDIAVNYDNNCRIERKD